MASHNITLPPDLSQIATGKVESGKFASVSEFIRSCIRVSEKVEAQQEMRNRQLDLIIDKAEKDLEEGNYIDFDSLDEMSTFLMQSAQEVIQRAEPHA